MLNIPSVEHYSFLANYIRQYNISLFLISLHRPTSLPSPPATSRLSVSGPGTHDVCLFVFAAKKKNIWILNDLNGF